MPRPPSAASDTDPSPWSARWCAGSGRRTTAVERPRRRRRGRSLPSWAVQTARLEQREPFITADGSSIRELAGIPTGNAANQSLAEATVPPGGETAEHYHRTSEEIYLFTKGMGRMRLGDQRSEERRVGKECRSA